MDRQNCRGLLAGSSGAVLGLLFLDKDHSHTAHCGVWKEEQASRQAWGLADCPLA